MFIIKSLKKTRKERKPSTPTSVTSFIHSLCGDGYVDAQKPDTPYPIPIALFSSELSLNASNAFTIKSPRCSAAKNRP